MLQKIEKILELQDENNYEKTTKIISDEQIAEIENILNKKIPNEIKNFWKIVGEKGLFGNLLFTAEICDFDEIKNNLQFSQSPIKSSSGNLSKENEKKFISEIIDIIFPLLPKHQFFGFKKSWDFVELDGSPESFGGPYFFKNTERKVLDIEDFTIFEKVTNIIKNFQESEKYQHNWDEIIVKIFPDKTYELERKNWDFGEANLVSIPEKYIQKKYFDLHWIPLFSDCGGNYIGVYLDTDEKGTFGQIINFGRDEEEMYVFGKNLDEFLDFVIKRLEKAPLDGEEHFIDEFKEFLKNNF